MYAPESIELLTKSGINFKKHEEYGIDVEQFGEVLISSGLVLLDDVKWISFHRWVWQLRLKSIFLRSWGSGYDFGYLLKLVSCAPLPPNEDEFFDLLKIWFPCIYDISESSVMIHYFSFSDIICPRIPDAVLQITKRRIARCSGRTSSSSDRAATSSRVGLAADC